MRHPSSIRKLSDGLDGIDGMIEGDGGDGGDADSPNFL